MFYLKMDVHIREPTPKQKIMLKYSCKKCKMGALLILTSRHAITWEINAITIRCQIVDFVEHSTGHGSQAKVGILQIRFSGSG